MKSLLTLKINQKSDVRYVSSSIFTYKNSAKTHHESKEVRSINEPLVSPHPSATSIITRSFSYAGFHTAQSHLHGSCGFGLVLYCSCRRVPINLLRWVSPPRTVFIQLRHQPLYRLVVMSRSQSWVSNSFSKESRSIIYFLVLSRLSPVYYIRCVVLLL